MATLVGIVSMVVNVAVSFMTDGNWKTAGLGLTQLYWERANQRRRYLPSQAIWRHREGSFRANWSAARSVA